MQGNLQEIDICSILKLLESKQQTGILYVETEPKQSIFNDNSFFNSKTSSCLSSASDQTWFIFFVDGNIVYSTDSKNTDYLRLKDYLFSVLSEDIPNKLTPISEDLNNFNENQYLVTLLQQNRITPSKAQSILKSLVQENLFEILGLYQGKFIFRQHQEFLNHLIKISPSYLIRNVFKELQSWHSLSPYIYSKNQYFASYKSGKIQNILGSDAYQKLSYWVENQTSLLRVSRQLNCSLTTLAKAVHPYVKKNWIKLLANPSQATQNQSVKSIKEKPHILYINNDVANSKNVEYILKQRDYTVTIVEDSIKGLSLILQAQPDVILCDIDTPQISGYELCTMLQNSQIGQKIPIILLTEYDSFLDRIRANVVSSTDCLTKPVMADQLLLILEKYLSSVNFRQLEVIGQS